MWRASVASRRFAAAKATSCDLGIERGHVPTQHTSTLALKLL